MSPEGQVWGALFLAVIAGFLACIVVELAFGRGGLGARAAIGIGLAVVDVVAFAMFLQVAIGLGVAAGPSQSASGPGGVVLAALVPWIIPAARLWMLRRAPRPGA